MTKLDWRKAKLREPDAARAQQMDDFVEPDQRVISVTEYARPDLVATLQDRAKERKARKHIREKEEKAAAKVAKRQKEAELAKLLRR